MKAADPALRPEPDFTALREAVVANEQALVALRRAVAACRDLGRTWSEIALVLRVTKQTARMRLRS